MGTLSQVFAQVFRDFATDGVAASGLHEPVKSEIRALGRDVDSAVTLLAAAFVADNAVVVTELQATLFANLVPAEPALGVVYNDGANNGLYAKIGGTGTGSWDATDLMLRGADGADGLSFYEIAIQTGYVPEGTTEETFINAVALAVAAAAAEDLAPLVDDLGLGIESAVKRVSLALDDVQTVAPRAADLAALAPREADLAALGPRAGDLEALAPRASDVQALAPRAGDIEDLAPVAASMATLGPVAGDIPAVAGVAADIPNAAAYRVIAGRGMPDAMTTGTGDGSFYLESTVGWLVGPKAGGVWPSTYVNQGRVVGGVEPCAVVFFMGQSNADGWSTDPQNTTALTAGYGFEYYCDASGIGSILPLGPVRLGRLTGGPQAAFAQTWAAGGGGAVVCVDCAAGGSSIVSAAKTALSGAPSPALLSGGTWDQADAANLYTNYFLPHMRLALTEIARKGFDIRRQIVYWSQGEQDALANTSQANHEAALRAFLRKLKADFPSIKFLIERLGHNRDNTTPTQHANQRAAQTAVAADPEFSGWVKVCSTLAEGFSTVVGAGNPDFSDTLHYIQGRYNDLGVEMATQGLAFAAADYALPVPAATKWNALLANMPLVPNWYRCAIKTKANGAFGLSSFNDPANHYCTTFYDTTWANRNSTVQTLAWTFPDASEKEIMMYVHNSATGDISITGTATSAVSDITAIDAEFPLHTISIGIAGAQASGIGLTHSDLYRFSTSKMRVLNLSVSSGTTAHAVTNDTLDKLPGLTTLGLSRSQNSPTLDLAKVPNLTVHAHTVGNLSVAEVNARLIALDAGGLTGGNCTLNQYSAASPVSAIAVPTGTGLAAKGKLVAKGWTVTVDVTGAAPANTVAPVASGTGTVGQVLSVTDGTWTNSPSSYAYQWRRGGVSIAGANSSTYTLVAGDSGTNVDCRVTATNSGGSVGANSNAIAVS